MSDPTPAAAAAAPAKSRKKLLLVIIAAVVLLGGGGAGAWFFLHKPADESAEDGGKSAKNEKGDKAEKGKKGKKKESEPKLPAQFVGLDPPFVVNFEPGASARFLQITAQLMTRDPHMKEFLEANNPIIRNDLLLLFGNRHVEEVATHEGKEKLRADALQAVRKIVKEEGGEPEEVEAVYFTSFVMQ
ncbi:MAG TPA: flagellar basal body-associated FliL family protein [Steroidobacteraceae bacterium]|nr:flagellar basal body-associated FliL family protein [Steroidobacteraceae bacterium]